MKWRWGPRKPAGPPVATRASSLGKRAVDIDGDPHVVITGDHNVILGDTSRPVPARAPVSVYEAEIRMLAATRFQGREKELAEMRAFALGEDPRGPAYWRWLAPAWSGKTALMAEFALNPPPGVHVLAFFITARLAGRSDRTAFLSELRRQLRAYLEDGDLDCDGYGGFHDALRRAVERAREQGRRLVLVVDGMDEDSGVESAFAGFSIAALLPAVPPEGLRVIVAGRPNPPVPADVPGGHPLRTAGINRELTESPAAGAVREDAERSLHDMIAAGGISRDLVGLTSAAGGGLSAADLALLIGDRTPRQIEAALGGATGRSFQLRPAQWPLSDGHRPSLYAFAHQELVVGARALLRPSVLDGYRARVHDFVAGHRQRGWPQDTPEYALTGYPQLLREQRDTPRLTALATDPARHERLWHTTGSDTGALTEIADAFALHRAESDADLVSCVRLSSCRDELQRKARSYPPSAITVLADLGHGRKAVALLSARIAVSPLETRLFADLLRRGLVTGETDVVLNAVYDIADPTARDQALRACAGVLAQAGRIDSATELARMISAPRLRCEAFTGVARALTDAGRPEQAVGPAQEAGEAARTVASPVAQAEALVMAALAMVAAGRADQAVGLASEIADVAHGVAAPDGRASALLGVAEVWAAVGRTEDAADLARAAVRAAEGGGDAANLDSVLMQAVDVLLRVGEEAEAVRLAHAIDDPQYRSHTLARAADAWAEQGRPEDATTMAHAAAEAANGITAEGERGMALRAVVEVLVKAGKTEEAARLARAIGAPEIRWMALLDVADMYGEARRSADAADLAGAAAEAAGRVSGATDRARAFHHVTLALMRVGQTEVAARIAHEISAPEDRAAALRGMALGMMEAGRRDEAARYGHLAAEVAGLVGEAQARAAALLSVVRVMERTEQREEAARLARTVAELALTLGTPSDRAALLVGAARALADLGETEYALHCVDTAIEVARTAPQHVRTCASLLAAARALAKAGRAEEAAELALGVTARVDSFEDSPDRDQVWWNVARTLAETGPAVKAVRVAETALRSSRRTAAADADAAAEESARGLGMVAQGLAQAGWTDEAARLAFIAADSARGISDPVRQGRAYTVVVEALAKAGLIENAVRLSKLITWPDERVTALAAVTRVLARTARTEEAVSLARAAGEVAGTAPNPAHRRDALMRAAQALAWAGRQEEAVELAGTIAQDTGTPTRAGAAGAFARVAEALADAGSAEEAVRLADRAAALAGTTPSRPHRASALAGVARALATANRLDRAAEFARTITASAPQASALAALAKAHGTSAEGKSLLCWALSLQSHERLLDALATVSPEALDEAVRCATT